MTIQDAIKQNPAFPCPEEILASQVLVPVRFYTFDGSIGAGEIVIDGTLANDIKDLFELIFVEKFPIASAIPLASTLFSFDDERSMAANNTSGFNYRHITGSEKISNHALGRAIDINPVLNPCIKENAEVQPAGAVYNIERPGTISADSFIVKFLKERGWTWGGDWTNPKDYQHLRNNKIGGY